MAPLQRKLRRALGSMKDQTSIGLARVASHGTAELEIAIVKATRHDESPISEKYVQEIISLSSLSRGYTNACVAAMARRLAKTHNWIVAIKGLMLTHRLMGEGDPSFEQELLYCNRHGMRALNLSNFRDDSCSHAWDYSAFVRTYALFLDEKLQLNLEIAKDQLEDGGGRRGSARDGHDGHRDDDAYHDRRRDDGSGYGARRDDGSGYGTRRDEGGPQKRDEYGPSWEEDDYSRSRNGRDADGYGTDAKAQRKKKPCPVKDMAAKDLLGRIPAMQRLLDRVLACRPTGAARSNRLVQIALYPVVRESFQLYTDICDGLAIILDAFFEMDHVDCVKAFEMYSKAAKQIVELASFHSACKDFGVCRSSEYPVVQRISEEVLETMDDFLKDRHQQKKNREPLPESPDPMVEDGSQDVNSINTLPAPPVTEQPGPPQEIPNIQREQSQGDLVEFGNGPVSAEEHGDHLALALFSDTAGTSTHDSTQTSNGNTNVERSLVGWELALVESSSEISKPVTNALAGGFNNLLLTSMYDQGGLNQKLASSVPSGSASSVALPGQPASSFLALPAAVGTQVGAQLSEDPFAASLSVPPPSFVQMSDVLQKQQLLVQEQQMWYLYQRDGMQGYNGLMKFHNPTYNGFVQMYQPVPYYGSAYY